MLSDVVDGADVGVVERRSGTSFAPEAFQCLWILGYIIGQELESHETPELGVLGLINHPHAAATELFNDAIARDGLANH